MTVKEAVVRGIERLRLEVWADPHAYLKLDLLPGGMSGPWAHLYDRVTQEAIGEPTPQDILAFHLDSDDRFVAYAGPRDRDDSQQREASSRP